MAASSPPSAIDGVQTRPYGWIPFATGGVHEGFGGAFAVLCLEAFHFGHANTRRPRDHLFRLWNNSVEQEFFVEADAFTTIDHPPDSELVTGALFLGNDHEEAPVARLRRFDPRSGTLLHDAQSDLHAPFGEQLDRLLGEVLHWPNFCAFKGLDEEEFSDLARAMKARIPRRIPQGDESVFQETSCSGSAVPLPSVGRTEPPFTAVRIELARAVLAQERTVPHPFVVHLYASVLDEALDADDASAAAALEGELRQLRSALGIAASPAVVATLARAAAARGDRETAETDAREALTAEPRDAKMWALRCTLARHANDLDRAEQHLRDGFAAQAVPETELFLAEGLLATARGEGPRAVFALQKVLAAVAQGRDANADDSWLQRRAHVALAPFVGTDEALADTLAAVAEKDPRFATLLLEHLDVLTEADVAALDAHAFEVRRRRAVRLLKLHTAAHPDDFAAHRTLARYALLARKPDRALLQEAVAALARCKQLFARGEAAELRFADAWPSDYRRVRDLFETVDAVPSERRDAFAQREVKELLKAPFCEASFVRERVFRIYLTFGDRRLARRIVNKLLAANSLSRSAAFDAALLAADLKDLALARRLLSAYDAPHNQPLSPWEKDYGRPFAAMIVAALEGKPNQADQLAQQLIRTSSDFYQQPLVVAALRRHPFPVTYAPRPLAILSHGVYPLVAMGVLCARMASGIFLSTPPKETPTQAPESGSTVPLAGALAQERDAGMDAGTNLDATSDGALDAGRSDRAGDASPF